MLAGIKPQEDTSTKKVMVNNQLESSGSGHQRVEVDFENTDDNIILNSQEKEENMMHFSQKIVDNRDSLSFKPSQFLGKETNNSNMDIPMSFGSGALEKHQYSKEIDDAL